METIFLEVVNRSLSAGVLIIGIIFLRMFLKRASKGMRYILWLFVAIRLICPLPLESSFSLMPDVETITGQGFLGEWSVSVEEGNLAAAEGASLTAREEDLAAAEGTSLTDKEGNYATVGNTDPTKGEGGFAAPEGGFVPAGDLGSPARQESQSADLRSPARQEGQSADLGLSRETASAIGWGHVLPWVWVLGMAMMAFYGGVSYHRIKRSLRTAVRMEGNLWQSEQVVSPFIMGILRPRIYLPFSLQEPEMTYVLAHERSHIRHGDHVIKPFGFALLAVYWFHPLVWVAFILLCRDMELACDERVVKSLGAKERKEYAESLLALSVKGNEISACPVAFGEAEVKGRIREVLNYKKTGFWMMLLAVVACLIAGVCFLTEPKEKAPESQDADPNPSEEMLADNHEKDSEEFSKEILAGNDEKDSEGFSEGINTEEVSTENDEVDLPIVPEEVRSKAEEVTQAELHRLQAIEEPEAEYDDWRIDCLEFSYEYEQLLGIDLVIYNYAPSFHVKHPEDVVLVGGMVILDGEWVNFYGTEQLYFQRTSEGLRYLGQWLMYAFSPEEAEDKYVVGDVVEGLVGYPYPEEVIEDVPEIENLEELLGDWDAWIYDQAQVVERAFDYFNEQNLGDGIYAYKTEEGYPCEYMNYIGAGPHQACVQSTEEGYVIVVHMDRRKGYWRATGYHVAKI